MDELLIKKYRGGDTAAFESLYDIHAGRALRLARIITRDDQLAADAVQEAFIRSYIYRHKLRAGERFDLWFNKIVVNESKRQLRKNSKVVSLPLSESDMSSAEDKYPFETYQTLYEALEKLPEILRTAVALKYLGGYSEQQIAAVLKTNQNTVKSRLYQARQKLSKLISEEEV